MTIPFTAYNAAIAAQVLRNTASPRNDYAPILVAEGEGILAARYDAAQCLWLLADKLVGEIVAQRPRQDDWVGEMFGSAEPASPDAELEALIAAAEHAAALAWQRLAPLHAAVCAVADRIVARVPGAALADTGIA